MLLLWYCSDSAVVIPHNCSGVIVVMLRLPQSDVVVELPQTAVLVVVPQTFVVVL